MSSSKIETRQCLICANLTNTAHLGMDICRACAVFYKRYHARESPFVCRSASGNCASGRWLNCKSCRLELIRTRMAETVHAVRSRVPPPIEDEPTTGPAEPLSRVDSKDRPLLAKLKTAYKWMSYARLSSEIYSRTDIPRPLRISLEEGPFLSAGSFDSLSSNLRIFLSAALQFGADVFPEFAALPLKEQWPIVVNFFYFFSTFEGSHRSNLIFPNDPDKYFMGYSSWTSCTLENLWNADSATGDLAGALKYIENQDTANSIQKTRRAVARVNPCPEEFLTVMVLMFFDETNSGEEIGSIGEKYRKMVLDELYAFYRDELKLEDYASRLGEVMLLLQVCDVRKYMKEQVEVLRLFNVVQDDNFLYALQKE